MYGASNAAHAQDWETVDRFQERAWSLRAESGALRAYFYLRKIEVSRLRGEYSSMEDCYAEVLTHAHPEKDVDLLARFYLLRTAILALKADNEASKEDLKQAWVYAKKGPSAISRSECFLNEAYHHYREGNADDAAFAYRRAIRLLTPLRPSALLAGHYRRLSHALTAAGDASGAARARQEAMGLVHRDANPTLFARLLSSDAIYYRSRDADHALELMKEALNLSRQGVDRHTKLSVYQRAIHLFLGQDGLYPFFDILDEMELLVTDSEDGFFLADVYCVRGYLAAEAGECARALRFVELAWSEAQPFEGQVEIPGLLAKLALVSVLAGDSVRGKDMLDRLDAYSGQIWEGVAAGKYATRARELLAAGAS